MEEINNQEEYELIRERIKTRPINRRKLFRRTVITAAMAVIFGVLACITFLVLEPVFSNMLTPEEEPVPNEVKIPIYDDEILPEDMILEDDSEPATQIIYQEMERTTTVLEDYNSLYDEIYNLSKVCQKSIVEVAGVNQDVDWFNDSYESQKVTTGLIIANNGIELLIVKHHIESTSRSFRQLRCLLEHARRTQRPIIVLVPICNRRRTYVCISAFLPCTNHLLAIAWDRIAELST